MDNKRLSIILPFFKLPLELLDNCLGSIYKYNQNLDSVEVILINDGSPTSPESVLLKSEYREVKYIVQDNMGLGGARNTGLLNASGEYILFMDGDDYLVRGAVDDIVNWILQNKQKEIPSDCLRFGYNIVSSLDYCIASSKTDLTVSTVDAASHFETHNLSSHVWRNVIRKDCIINDEFSLFFENRIYCEDELWTPQMMLRISLIDLTKDRLYCYYANPNSIMRDSNNRKKQSEDWKCVIKEMNRIAKSHNCPLFFVMRLRKNVLAHIHLLAYQQAENQVLEDYIIFLKQEGLFPIKLLGCNENVTTKMHVFARLCNYRITRRLTFNYLRDHFKRK